MNVTIVDIRQDHLDAAVAELDGGAKVLALQLDVTDRAAFAKAADAVEARFGKIHLLVNNAGVAVVGPTELATFSDWDWVNGVNVGGTVNGVVTILPRILAHGEGGHIVCTASMSALVPAPGTAIYSAGKAYVTSMMECMRPELESRGVICSAFCPGAVQSNIAEAGKTRPDALAETGYAEADKRRQAGGSFAHLYQTKEEVGERVLEGILNDELYILTHSEFLVGVRERGEAMTLAVQDHLPENPEYKATFAMLFRNPAITDEIARQQRLKDARKA
jgi:NAD(P)-dependent dehydrogenase (short-subunit alcohol dehydrogenase family)